MSVIVDKVMVEQRAASFTRRSIKNAAKRTGLRLALSMLDLTTLEGKDSPDRVRALCRKAITPDAEDPSLPAVAAVCVYPAMVAAAAGELSAHNSSSPRPIRIASVATGFPSGQYPLAVRLDDTRRAIDDGADEIDMVISRGLFLSGERGRVADEIAAVKEVCAASGPGRAALKVILETGELETYDNVRAASDLAMRAGLTAGDFIKTSTGKVQPAATLPVTLIMLEAVRDHFVRTGVRVGVKPAGGIRTAKQALQYLVMVKETLGDEWLTPELFRFGASTLTNDILMQLRKLRTGVYSAAHDFADG